MVTIYANGRRCPRFETEHFLCFFIGNFDWGVVAEWSKLLQFREKINTKRSQVCSTAWAKLKKNFDIVEVECQRSSSDESGQQRVLNVEGAYLELASGSLVLNLERHGRVIRCLAE